MKKIVYVFLIAILSCQSHEPSSQSLYVNAETAYPTISIKNGKIQIAIQSTKVTDSSTIYTLMSSYARTPVGFALAIPQEKSGKNKSSTSYIKSLGAPSDEFLQVLGDLYRVKIDSSARMMDSVPLTSINLHSLYGTTETPIEGDLIAAQYKIFFGSKSGEAELYMNIEPDKWIEFAETNEDDKKDLIQILTQKGR